ncbi:MAG: hypothetical protein GTO51_05340 [Candidatus Latescibacteria bacterium]|nr:hypothetical protein [Candidatus Latescibacterota bacterium]NIO28427.1 hypothetical protein [Candidatus Latescibacterota bacterium]NIO55976.1 hypothetical protein [Candidatus Latescibacterota bacterium]NIT01940.1 hypothetical protein [Candidatus Latescibacterota bacterium]
MERQKKKITLSCSVDAYRSGWTVVDFLAHRFPYHFAEGWRQRILDRRVRVNDTHVEPDDVVQKDDVIQYTICHAEPEVDFRYDIIHEDEHVLAVSKSGNLPVHACGVFITHTLISKLRERYGKKINLAHRLDRETSGLVLLSKNTEAARAFGRMFNEGKVAKKYIAIVRGRILEEQFEVDAPVGKVEALKDKSGVREGKIDLLANRGKSTSFDAEMDVASYLPKRKIDFVAGKAARTQFACIRYAGDYTVLEAIPLTGRTNQIRVHLAHIGFPVVGDKVYGLTGELKDECLRNGLTKRVKQALVMDRHALHCHILEFEHPVTGVPMRLDAPIPEDMKWAFD